PLDLLHGLPIGVKDLQATGGLRTTYGSLLHKDDVPEQDDDTVASLRDAGAIVLAKTNTPEFGAGANTRNRVYGATGNPFDPSKTCGGSSGGSAVALATGMVPLATGSDYGGSLRTPAAFCGVAGFRPSPGLVPDPSRGVALNPFSVQGPMGRTVEDLFLLLRAQIGTERVDPYASDDALAIPDVLDAIDPAALIVATTPDLGCAPMSKQIADTFADRVGRIGSAFGTVAADTPDLSDVHEIFEILRGVNFVAAHRARLENHRDLLGPNVIDNTERGLAYSAGDVAWALAAQAKLHARVHAFFENYDVLVCPSASVSPFPHAQLSITEIDGVEMSTYMRWLAITYALTTGLCSAATIPCGRDAAGLPFGVQIVGPRGADAMVLSVALDIERRLQRDETARRPVPDIEALTNAAPLEIEVG
ncbi:MAG: amidase family protein, partial [Pseudomonadota bacterium]